MRTLYRWISPPVLAILLLLGIRLVTDVPQHYRFWESSFTMHLQEFFFAILASYIFDFMLRLVMIHNQKKRESWKRKNLFIEYAQLVLVVVLILNPVVAIIHYFTNEGYGADAFVIANVVGILLLSLYYTVVRSDKISEDYAAQRLQLEKMKNDQLQTELKFLKSQYHPHFLFNALNTVYFQIDEKNEAPRRTLEMLSDLLRYQLYGANKQVTMQQEIDYLKTYIGLQTLRMSERLQLTTFFDPALSNLEVQPLLFLPLVENAFKYAGGDYRIDIDARAEGNKIIFKIENSIPLHAPASRPDKQGIGLENLKRRLDLLYAGKYVFEVGRRETFFVVKLIIEVKKDEH
ncbi:histidine kinase [uncultured Bacteroides sp.]|uniref:sensor histidine kinase n=1 Tax=uncultured Bacteroides sp. TaxID=162156 RepID=UPI002AA602E8|nr:histidine kinase [uncultured Bacteroides sp.]